MAAMGQPDHLSTTPHLNGIPRLPSTQGTPHPAAFSSAWASDYRERFMMEMHTPYGRPFTNGSPSYHQSMESSSVWQLPRSASDMHLQAADSAIRVSSGTMMDNERAPDSLNRGSPPSSLQRSSSSEMYDSPVVSGDWRQFVDTGLRYSAMPPPSSSPLTPNTSHAGGARGLNEGAMIRELIGRMGGNGISTHGVAPLVSSPQQQRSGTTIEKTLKLGNAWNSVPEGPSNAGLLSVDPSKGGLSLNGVGLSTSHCLAHFPSDPGFAERAARFSSFGSGNYAQTFPDPAKLRSRSSAALLGESTAKQLTRTSSCPPLRDTGVVTSPDSAILENHASAGLDDLPDEKNGEAEEGKLSVKALSRSASNLVPMEDEQQVGTTCVEDLPAGIQGMSTPDQANGEICPSGATSVIDISANKRKCGPEEKVVDLGPDMPASSQGERDAKTPESEDAKVKRLRRGEGFKGKEESKSRTERSGSETSGETSPRSIKDQSKPSEPPKPDYIHVRARRGQATDSHSLAERVRREKISERMKFLQDLVPGCSKVTGKAVMLDEIINYVQSLQRQVEFLSMKLASVNPRVDFNLENFLGKEVSPHPGSQTMVLGSETSVPYHQMHPQHQTQLQHCLPVGLDYPLNLPSEVSLTRSVNVPPIAASIPGVDGFGECQQLQTQWDDGELQSVVQMSFGNAQSMPPQALHCHLPPGQVKVELQQPPISCL